MNVFTNTVVTLTFQLYDSDGTLLESTEEPIAYHDHLIPGAPGLGTNGTARGDYKAPWRIVAMVYNPAYSNRSDFEPITSDEELAAAEAAGEFLPINPGAADPYQRWTDNVLICPIVRHNQR